MVSAVIVSVPGSLFIPITNINFTRRFIQLVIGLVLFGAGIGMMLQSGLGVPPWDVLHQGLATRFGLSVGIWSVIVSVGVLILWLPLREPYGLGTLLNAIIIGVVIDMTALALPDATSAWASWALLIGGILIIGLSSGMYIGANMGPGPRDGLMTGIAKRGHSIRLTRAVIEIVVLGIGWLLGGTFGVGTVIFALAIGPLVQFFLPRWTIDSGVPADGWVHPAR